MRTIALEEHFWTAELAAPPGTGPLATWGQRVDDQLRDLGRERLADMDANGIDLQVISHVAPAAQGLAGAEALACAREKLPDLILLDIMMPKMDGFELLHHCNTLPPSHRPARVIAISGEYEASALHGQPVAFLPKPFNLDVLLNMLGGKPN